MANVKYVIAILGAGSVGSNFLKEFGRFLAYHDAKDSVFNIGIIDEGVVTKDCLSTHPYLKEDIGLSKAGVISEIIDEVFPSLRRYQTAFKLKTFCTRLELSSDFANIMATISDVNYYQNTPTVVYLIDTICSSVTRRLCENYKVKSSNVIYIDACVNGYKGVITSRVRIQGKELSVAGEKTKLCKKDNSVERNPYMNLVGALKCVNILMSIVCNGIINNKITAGQIPFHALDYFSRQMVSYDMKVVETPLIAKTNANEHHVIACIGTGGTGGNFVKEFARFMQASKGSVSISLVLVDGDYVEAKNSERQPFIDDDLSQNKAIALKRALYECFELEKDSVTAYPYYIDTVLQLGEALVQGSKPDKNNKYYLLGAVDNHRARQVMHELFDGMKDIVYIDAANEFSYGEVVFSEKENGEVISPARAYYFPDVLTDDGPRASELSCGVVNITAPQHIITNTAAAQICLTSLVKRIVYGVKDCGVVYFDAFQPFSRFQEYIEQQGVEL